MPQIDNSKRATFWSDFGRNYWERRSALLLGEQVQWFPTIVPGELFAVAVACADAFRRSAQQRVRAYIEGIQVDLLGNEYGFILPKREDGSFEGYNDRLAAGHRVSDYALIIADWHRSDRLLWERVVNTVQGLADAIGVTPLRMDTQLFVGTYRVTPFGAHADPTGVFHFPVIGTKRMRFWEEDFAECTPQLRNARNYEQFTADSTEVTARPGEVIYWPSHKWHVAESEGAFSVTWGFGYWYGNRFLNLLIQELTNAAAEIDPPLILPRRVLNEAKSLPGIEDIIGAVRSAVSSSSLRVRLVQKWLEHYSACGFSSVPPLDNARSCLSTCGFLHKRSVLPLLWSEIDEDAICVACAGHSVIVNSTPNLLTIIDSLNDNNPIQLPAIYADTDRRNSLMEVIDLGLRTGVLALETGEGAVNAA